MRLKRLFAAVLAAVSMLTMGMMLSGCGGGGDSKEDAASAGYTTQDEAVQAATKESQEVVKQIEAREGKVVVIWANTAEDASIPFTLGLVEKDGDSWKVTNTASVTMTDKFSGKGSYPAVHKSSNLESRELNAPHSSPYLVFKSAMSSSYRLPVLFTRLAIWFKLLEQVRSRAASFLTSVISTRTT